MSGDLALSASLMTACALREIAHVLAGAYLRRAATKSERSGDGSVGCEVAKPSCCSGAPEDSCDRTRGGVHA